MANPGDMVKLAELICQVRDACLEREGIEQ